MQPLLFGLSWMHIFFVVLWLGSFFFELLTLFPALPALSTSARGELLQKVVGRAEVPGIAFSTVALAFGALLMADMAWGNPGLLTGTTWGLYVSIGAMLGLIAYLKFLLLDYPAIKKMLKASSTGTGGQQDAFSGRPPMAMLVGVVVQAALLLSAFTFMVAAAQV